jgi:hypothetical protein
MALLNRNDENALKKAALAAIIARYIYQIYNAGFVKNVKKKKKK